MEGVGSWSGGQQKGVQRGERPQYSPQNYTRRTRAGPMDPLPGPSGLPLLAGTRHHLYPSHWTDFLPQSLPQTQRQV